MDSMDIALIKPLLPSSIKRDWDGAIEQGLYGPT